MRTKTNVKAGTSGQTLGGNIYADVPGYVPMRPVDGYTGSPHFVAIGPSCRRPRSPNEPTAKAVEKLVVQIAERAEAFLAREGFGPEENLDDLTAQSKSPGSTLCSPTTRSKSWS